MRKRFMTIAATCGIALAVASPAVLAVAADEPIAVAEDGTAVTADQLSVDQLAAFIDAPASDSSVVSDEEAAALGIDEEEGGIPEDTAPEGSDDISPPSYATRYKQASFKRGSALMWTRDTVYFGYNGTKVTSSKGWQERGYILPNIAKNSGITRYSATTSTHKWRAKNTIGAGVPTPWGDVKLYSNDFTHYFSGNRSGGWSWTG
ncbi:hypothetical protein [Streptomyces nodosus]|uniref:hypothetical protein n=1 Tax=Streptomyces nodosus TaxID=40318 RepID=UPI00382553BE